MSQQNSVAESPRATDKLLGSSLVVGSMTMLSRVVGLLRDIVIARFFGAGENADAFFVAFRIPQFLRRLFAEGAFAQAFVPVLAEYRNAREASGDIAAIRTLVNAVCGVLGGTLLLITALVVAAAPLVTMLFAPGFINQPDKFELTVALLRITFPYLLLISLTGFAGAILNSYDRFVVPAFTPVLLNISLIACALWLSPQLSEPVFALAWGVMLAGFAQLLFQLPFLARLELVPRPVWNPHHPGVKKIKLLMLPAIFGVSVSQINLLLDTVLASFLPSGSVSWLYYSDRLAELPLGVFGIAIATVILPSLSRLKLPDAGQQLQQQALESDAQRRAQHRAQQNIDRFRHTLDWALRCVVVIAVPASCALIVLAQPILYLLFQYQAMTPQDVVMASYSMRAYALGLLAFMAIKVLATGFYAQQDMRAPVRIGIIAMVVNMVLNLLFVGLLHVYLRLGHVGLALATSLAAYLNAGLLYRGLARGAIARPGSGLLGKQFWWLLRRIIAAAVLMCVVLYGLLPAAEIWAAAGFTRRLIEVVILCGGGLAGYMGGLLLLGVRIGHFSAAGRAA
ncbi:MAG: murein biosynthesis integral membrane protein MurJ [Pseudomonadales bacterium]|nr:murein biosynthesis integral membrane protein MurJ [Pseudomonadales bacterium]